MTERLQQDRFATINPVPSEFKGGADKVTMIRTAEAAWEGAFRYGKGRMRLGRGAFEGGFSYRTRMEDEGPARTLRNC
jgi:hypothetical protein